MITDCERPIPSSPQLNGSGNDDDRGSHDDDPVSRVRSVLIIDEQEPFLTSLGTSFRKMGMDVWIETSLGSALQVLRSTSADLVVSETNSRGQLLLDRLPEIRQANPNCLVAVVTSSPGIHAAKQAIRAGVDAYLIKPASAPLILGTLAVNGRVQAEAAAGVEWPSLDRAIWDYLHDVFTAAGSMSEAARRLKLDRRSLRRMLGKQAPL